MPPTLRDYQIDLLERVRRRAGCGVRRVLIQAAVGAGKTVIAGEAVRSAVAKGRRVLFLAHRRRLISQAAAKIGEFDVPVGVLMAGERTTAAPVQVASRDTLLSRSFRAGSMSLPPADLVLVDEAHRLPGDEYSKLVSMYPDAYHLGLTATPARDDGRGLGDFYQCLECCVPISRLIAEQHLVPVRCFAPQNVASAKRKLAGDPVTAWKALAAGRPTVLFAGTVATSRAVRDAFESAGVTAEHIDAHTPDEERDAIIRRVEAGRTQVITNCNVLTEGVDIPCLSCVILLRLAQSYVLYIQAIGRVMRPHPSKRDAILIDHADAVLDHGFPDEDVRWELTESQTVDARNAEDRKAGKRSDPMNCPKCGLIFAAAPSCPACAYRFPAKKLPPTLRAQILTEVEQTLTPEQRRARRVAHWHECLGIMAHKGLTVGAAAGMFRSRYPEGPQTDFPNYPQGGEWRQKVADAFPQYVRR